MDGERLELTIIIGPDPEKKGHLQVEYLLPNTRQPQQFFPSRPRQDLCRFDHCTGLDALRTVLESGEASELTDWFCGSYVKELGKSLFEILFGPSENWKKSLHPLQQDSGVSKPGSPTEYPVRVRIWTEDEAVLGLPWSATTWRGSSLIAPIAVDSEGRHIGWSFEVARLPARSGHEELAELPVVTLKVPCRILLFVAAQSAPQINAMAHLQSLYERLHRVAPRQYSANDGEVCKYLEVATSFADCREKLAKFQPEILYFYGHGEIRNNRLLLNGENDIAALCDHMAPGHVPKLAFFNGCHTGGLGWYAAGHQLLGRKVPVVIANTTIAYSDYAPRMAEQWFEDVLGKGMDPVLALHRYVVVDRSAERFDWAVPIVHAAYKRFEIDNPHSPQYEKELFHRVNRDDQRRMAYDHMSRLADSPTDQVKLLVGYGAPDDCIALLPAQIWDTLRKATKDSTKLRVLTIAEPLPWPRDGDPVDDQLAEALEQALCPGGRGHLDHAFRQRAERVGHRVGVLWLPFKLIDAASTGIARPSEDALKELAQAIAKLATGKLTRDGALIASPLPSNLRLLFFLPICLPRSKFTAFGKALKSVRDSLWTLHGFTQVNLKALGAIEDMQELVDFLCETHKPPLSREKGRELADLIMQATAGQYDQVLERIQEGRAIGWNRLTEKLKPKQSA